MSFNAAMLEQMKAEGLDLDACIRVLKAAERKSDPTNAERQARHRAKKRNAVTVTPVTPPNDKDILTPREGSEAKASSPQPWALPVGVSLQTWEDLKRNRQKKRLVNTASTWKTFNDDLARVSAQTGIPPPKLIELCVGRGWGGIYDPTDGKHGQANGIGKSQAAYRLATAGLDPDEPF